ISSYNQGANSIALQNDGKILIGGYAFDVNGLPDFALIRLQPNGDLDGTFGSGGTTTVDFYGMWDEIRDLAVQADGKIVAAGMAQNQNYKRSFAVARFNTDGTTDAGF